MRALTPTAAALALLSTSAGAAKAKPRDAILLSQVESLTLRADRQTTHRRVPAVPQLKCVSSQAVCSKYKVDVMRCENKGSGYDDEDVQWSCSASLPPELKLGSTDVICEGYSSPGDPYVLKGSCAVEYRMSLTREGEEKWPDLGGGDGFDGAGGTGLAGWAFWVIFFSVLAFIVYNAFINSRRGGGGNAPRRNNGGGYWGGGGGGGGGGGFDDYGNDDAPPPYPGTNNYSNKSRRSGGSSAQRGGNAQQGWRPDWWSAAGGAAAGAAAGYGAGRMGRNNNNNNNRGYGNYGSTWGSGGGGPSRSGSSGSSSGSAVSNSRYESTGFGSTSRR